MKITFILIGVVVLAGLILAAWKTSRFAYESPAYTVLEKDGAFEIREYPAMTVAASPMDNPDPMQGETFMRLFRYISKGNEAEQKIAMTTPVFMTGGEDGEMAFVVPREVAAEGAPQPKSDKVSVREMEGGKVAVYRYRGGWSEEESRAARKTLADWVKARGLTTRGDYFGAGYDPPFTPPAMRRNEVLVRIAD